MPIMHFSKFRKMSQPYSPTLTAASSGAEPHSNGHLSRHSIYIHGDTQNHTHTRVHDRSPVGWRARRAHKPWITLRDRCSDSVRSFMLVATCNHIVYAALASDATHCFGISVYCWSAFVIIYMCIAQVFYMVRCFQWRIILMRMRF